MVDVEGFVPKEQMMETAQYSSFCSASNNLNVADSIALNPSEIPIVTFRQRISKKLQLACPLISSTNSHVEAYLRLVE